MPEIKPAERVGDYEFLDLLAVGGMGQLWRVRHVKLGSVYVAKVLRPDLRNDPEFATRFLHEARLVANFRHPNVVQVFGFDEEHMLYFMEYVEGMDLDRLMRLRKNLEFGEKRVVIEVVANAIGHAHRHHDLIHRDIKPSNVLIAITDPDDPILRSHVKLTDFGIARVMSLDQRVTMSSGVVMGTVHYMAPEQFEGHADKASDVYSIGVLYYQLLTGALPFNGPTPFVLRDKHRTEIAKPPHEVNPSVPLADSMTVMKCLEKDPANRFSDSAELYEHLADTMPTTRTMGVPRSRARAPKAAGEAGALPATQQLARDQDGSTRTAGPSQQATARTIPAAMGDVTSRTIPAGAAAPEQVTERTIPARRPAAAAPTPPPAPPPPARRPRRLWVGVALAVPAVAALAVGGFFLFRPARRGQQQQQQVTPGPHVTTEVPVPKVEPGEGPLPPRELAAARSLAEVVARLDREAEALAGKADAEPALARLKGYRDAVAQFTAAAKALGDCACDEAERTLRNAELELARIDGLSPAELPTDFLFRQTLSVAVGQARELSAKAARSVERVEPVADSKASIQYMAEKSKAAHAAVLESIAFTPGCTAYEKIRPRATEGASLEGLLKELGSDVPAPVALLSQYLAKLDSLLSYEPTSGQDGVYRVGVMEHLDGLVAAPVRLAVSPWMEACLPQDDQACLSLVEGVWKEAHRARLAEAVRQCHKLAADQMARAEALVKAPETAAEARRLFADAEATLEAIRKAARVAEEAKLAASGLLSTASAKRAMGLFCLAPRTPDEQDKLLTEVRRLLDRGLDELPGCDAATAAQARALREMLKPAAEARARLDACLAANFAAQAPYGGQVGTLFEALDACERLARELAKHGDHPCSRAAMEPFNRLSAGCCAGLALPNAAASWLLANALQSCEKGQYADAGRFLAGFVLAPGKEAQGVESPLKRLLPEPITAKAGGDLAKLLGCFDETKVPAEGAQPAERWKKLWERRLAGQPLLALDIPATVAPGSLPARFEGQEKQCEAVYAQMRKLLDHCRAKLQAEQALRPVEAEAEKLVVRGPDGVKPSPTATREAVTKCLAAIHQLKESGRHQGLDDHPARLAALERDLGSVPAQATVAEVRERVADCLAKSDPKTALDELKANSAALGRIAELELTRQALGAWVKLATKDIADQNFAGATEKFEAIRAHEQVSRHKDDAGIGATLNEISKPIHYCEAHRALAQGAKGLDGALAEFLQAAPYRDAEALAKQIAPLQEGLKLREAQPFRAVETLERLLEQKDLHATVRAAAQAAAGDTRAAVLAEAAACTKDFHQALAKGGWEDCLDRTAVSQEELSRLKAFLDQVEGIEVQQPDAPERGELVPDKQQVRLVAKRVLKFRYKLPDSPSVPMALEQAIEWTLRNVPPEQRKGRSWLIAGWEAR